MFSEWDDARSDPAILQEGPVYPPKGVLFVVAALVALTAVLLVVPSDLVHWAGYASGSIAVPVVVVIYRHLDKKRSAARFFVAKPGQSRVATTLLATGVLLGVMNAFLALQETRIR